jgi:hypothetical protein
MVVPSIGSCNMAKSTYGVVSTCRDNVVVTPTSVQIVELQVQHIIMHTKFLFFLQLVVVGGGLDFLFPSVFNLISRMICPLPVPCPCGTFVNFYLCRLLKLIHILK